MKALSQVRGGWAEIETVETQLLRDLSIEDGVRQVLELQRGFEAQLQQTEAVFRQPRNQTLIQMQARLATLNRSNGASMEQLFQSIANLQMRLEQAGIPSIVIGGLAVGAWGEPRLTRDADLKVLALREERGRILQLLADFTPLHADPNEAFRRHGVAFFQDPMGTRIDVMLAETSFDETAIGRARTVEIQPGLPTAHLHPGRSDRLQDSLATLAGSGRCRGDHPPPRRSTGRYLRRGLAAAVRAGVGRQHADR